MTAQFSAVLAHFVSELNCSVTKVRKYNELMKPLGNMSSANTLSSAASQSIPQTSVLMSDLLTQNSAHSAVQPPLPNASTRSVLINELTRAVLKDGSDVITHAVPTHPAPDILPTRSPARSVLNPSLTYIPTRSVMDGPPMHSVLRTLETPLANDSMQTTLDDEPTRSVLPGNSDITSMINSLNSGIINDSEEDIYDAVICRLTSHKKYDSLLQITRSAERTNQDCTTEWLTTPAQ